MSYLFNYIDELFKNEIPEKNSEKYASLFERNDFESMISGVAHHIEFERRVNKIRSRKDLSVIHQHDVEVYSAWDKRVMALLGTNLEITGDDESVRKFMEEQIMRHENQLKKDFLWAVPYGFNVEQIIYDESRDGSVKGFQRENFWRFEPQKDLVHVRVKTGGSSYESNGDLLPYGKYVLTVNNGSATNPIGESLFARLYLVWLWRCGGMDQWVRFAEKHGSGFLIGKTPHQDDVEALREVLDNATKAASIAVTTETEIDHSITNSKGEIYDNLNNQLVNMYLRAILGETQTSKMENRGGSQSSSVHNEVRKEKTQADATLVENGINEAIRQIAAVNEMGIPDRELPKAKIHLQKGLSTERAERDVKLNAAGVRFTKEYYERNYGLKEDEFEVTEPVPLGSNSPVQQSSGVSVQLADGVKEPRFGFKRVEDTVKYLERQNISPLKDKDILDFVRKFDSYELLLENMGDLFLDEDEEFVNQLTEGLYHTAIVGAIDASEEE